MADDKVKMIGVTGSTGVLGRILLDLLEAYGYTYSCFTGDIRDKNAVKEWLKRENFDYIFHLAAIVPISEVNKNLFEAFSVNVGGTLNLLAALSELSIKADIFYSSTSHVYETKDTPIKEDDDIMPINIYGETKYQAERICESYAQTYDIKLCIGRIFSYYHITQSAQFLFPNIVNRLKNENLDLPFQLYGADNVRDFLSAEEVAEIMIKLMQQKYSGCVNIGSGKAITIKEFVQNLTEKKLNILNKGDQKLTKLVANIDKLKNIVGEFNG